MPWSQTTPMDQKTQFIADYLREIFSFSELCARYGVSRDGLQACRALPEQDLQDFKNDRDDRTRVRTRPRRMSSKHCSSFVVVIRVGARRSCCRCWVSAIRAGIFLPERRCSRS